MPGADDFETSNGRARTPLANIAEAFLRVRESRERKAWREQADPILWTLLGLLLMACFWLALTTHWFPR